MAFDFGSNWFEFSKHALTATGVAEARSDFRELLGSIDLGSRSFLDIGFGQGLSLLTAAALGARAVGCDINPTCKEVLVGNASFYPEVSVADIPLVVGSILDPEVRRRLADLGPSGGFDVVHSWGVLHHTGELDRSLEYAAELVSPQGFLVLSIYRRHWSSRFWLGVKWSYGLLPRFGKRLMVLLFYPVLWAATWVVSGENPNRKGRGMNFYYDVVDWIGGYPYEFASKEEILQRMSLLGFECLSLRPPRVPTGCNEFVLKRNPK